MEKLVEIRNVYYSYNGIPVLEDIVLDIMEKDIMAIMGPNGGGKTTLLKIILGLIKPSSGKIIVLGGRPERERRSIGYLQQNPDIDLGFPVDVFSTVLMGRYRGPIRRYSPEDKEAVEYALEMVDMEAYGKRIKHCGNQSFKPVNRHPAIKPLH